MKKGLNVKRLELIRKGYINQKELAIFLDIGKSRASKIYGEIREQIYESGKTVDILGMRTAYVLDYLGLTENDIRRFAEDEGRYYDC